MHGNATGTRARREGSGATGERHAGRGRRLGTQEWPGSTASRPGDRAGQSAGWGATRDEYVDGSFWHDAGVLTRVTFQESRVEWEMGTRMAGSGGSKDAFAKGRSQ